MKIRYLKKCFTCLDIDGDLRNVNINFLCFDAWKSYKKSNQFKWCFSTKSIMMNVKYWCFHFNENFLHFFIFIHHGWKALTNALFISLLRKVNSGKLCCVTNSFPWPFFEGILARSSRKMWRIRTSLKFIKLRIPY